MCQNEVVEYLKQRRPFVENLIPAGADTSKSVFQLHGVDATGQPEIEAGSFWNFSPGFRRFRVA
jgi:hypothetical protein